MLKIFPSDDRDYVKQRQILNEFTYEMGAALGVAGAARRVIQVEAVDVVVLIFKKRVIIFTLKHVRHTFLSQLLYN